MTIAKMSLRRADFNTRSDSVVQLREGDALTCTMKEEGRRKKEGRKLRIREIEMKH